MATYVLVHGAYHGAWCWYKVIPELEARDHDVVTFDLPAHGIDLTPVQDVGFDDYVERVCEAIDACDGAVVLVGHSMAGMVITAVAERRPDRVQTLVYLTAYLPADGESMIDQRVEGSLISRNFSVDEERGVGVVSTDALNELFYRDCNRVDRTLARSLVRAEPIKPLSTPVNITSEGYGSVHRVYVRCVDDQAITATQQDAMIEDRGCDAVLSLQSSHSPFLAIPEKTIDALEAAISEP